LNCKNNEDDENGEYGMWHVEKNLEPGRGGFQNRDVGRSNFQGDFGPEYGTDYARYSDPPDYVADVSLKETIRFKISTSFPQVASQIVILVRNGFVILKGPELCEELRASLVAVIVALPGVKEIINQIPLKPLPRFEVLPKEQCMSELQDFKEKHIEF